MPRIDDKFLDCSIYLYPSHENAKDGDSIGGSGFLAAIPAVGAGWLLGDVPCSRFDYHHSYAVTNKHIAKKNRFVRLNREKDNGGNCTIIELSENDWVNSPDYDISVAPIAFDQQNRYLFISTDSFVTEPKLRDHDIGIGDEVFMVGRFINHEGRQRNNPSVRWGHIGMMPVEIVDYGAEGQTEKDFAVETHSISAYSGSPVFVRPFATRKLFPTPAHYGNATNTVVHTVSDVWSDSGPSSRSSAGPWLLGIQRAYIHFKDKDGSKQNTGMAAVIPAWHILSLLQSSELIERRKQEQMNLVNAPR
jgi:hypothetical protein